MKKSMYWALTPELVEKRKQAWDAFSDIYKIETQVLEQPEPPLADFVAEQNSSQSIYVFELNTEFSFEHCQIINKIFKYRAPRTVLLIGSLDGTNKLKKLALENWLPHLDGVITQSQQLADEIAMMFVYSVECVPFPTSKNKSERDFCVEKFANFLSRLRLKKCSNSAMEKVATELKYLGVSDDTILIDTVAETLSEFWE